MKLLERTQPVRVKSEGARDVLRQNLAALMSAHPILRSRGAIERRTDVAARTVGYMLSGKGNPTLGNIEAVAQAFHLEVWELLRPGLDVSKIAVEVSAKEAVLHRKIEESMKALGVTEYHLTRRRPGQ